MGGERYTKFNKKIKNYINVDKINQKNNDKKMKSKTEKHQQKKLFNIYVLL
jgi:hypothetical protein